MPEKNGPALPRKFTRHSFPLRSVNQSPPSGKNRAGPAYSRVRNFVPSTSRVDVCIDSSGTISATLPPSARTAGAARGGNVRRTLDRSSTFLTDMRHSPLDGLRSSPLFVPESKARLYASALYYARVCRRGIGRSAAPRWIDRLI